MAIIRDFLEALRTTSLQQVPICSWDLDGTAIKVGTPLNGQRLVVNIANDMCLRFQNNVSALYRTFDFPVHHYALGCNGSGNMSPAGDDEGSAMKWSLWLAGPEPWRAGELSARL